MIVQCNSKITMADKLSESMLDPILEQIGLLFNDHSLVQ